MQRLLIISFISLWLIIPLNAQESDFMADQLSFYTYHHESGNRFVQGQGTFPNVNATDYRFDAQATWLIAATQDTSADVSQQIVTVQLPDDRIIAVDPLTGVVDENFGTHPAEQPIVIQQWRGQWTWIGLQSPNATNVLSLYDNETRIIGVDELGNLFAAPASETSIALNIQPDAKVVASNDGRYAVYANATNQRYVHAIMGDDIEGASLVVFQLVDNEIDILTQIDLEGDAVYEGLSPMWADVNEDGVQDLITTVSDSRVGSRIRAYLFTDNGILTVDGQAIGQSNRWQHQLAWGAFGVNGEIQLVEVLTPHIGGVVRFYEFDGTNLSIVSQLRGYTSHIIGSRNLDMAIAGDFDGDGQPEIVLPSQDRTRIAGIANTSNGAQVMWELPVDGVVASNLTAVNTPNGLILAIGRTDGTIRIWTP